MNQPIDFNDLLTKYFLLLSTKNLLIVLIDIDLYIYTIKFFWDQLRFLKSFVVVVVIDCTASDDNCANSWHGIQ